MSDKHYSVVFYGITQPGKDREQVLLNVAKMFKTTPAKIKPLFAGGRKVIKGNIDDLMAEKYRVALERAGLVIKIEEADAAPATPSAAGAASPPKPDVKIDTGNISMAEVGADVLVNPVEVAPQPIGDISDISMAEVGADVLENPVQVTPQPIADISSLSMAEVGATVLENPPEVTPQPIGDISDISMAEVGADMIENPVEKKAAPVPDTSELSIK